VELLLVVFVISLALSIVLPASSGMYRRYRASAAAQKALIMMSKIQRAAFLTGVERYVDSQDGAVSVDGAPYPLDDVFVTLTAPITFYSNGTTSGGTLSVYVEDYTYRVNVQGPLGELTLEEIRTGEAGREAGLHGGAEAQSGNVR
jgi:type II secretory pathway pseudopilin PulG